MKAARQRLLIKDVKEFIKKDWVLTCHFIWDLLRKLTDLEDGQIELHVNKLYEKKKKEAGEKLT